MVQAIPTFAMSCSKLPVGLCDEIEALIRKLFWGQKGEQRKIRWKKWEVLCMPKSEGGMGSKIWENLMMQCWQNRFGEY